jgi:hypothetical protein
MPRKKSGPEKPAREMESSKACTEKCLGKKYLGPAQRSPGGWGAEESELASSRTLRQGVYLNPPRRRRGLIWALL